MEDSPLSITANVTGILTFAVAVIAAIYVRYKSLRDIETEIMMIKRSTGDDFGVLRLIGLTPSSRNVREDSSLLPACLHIEKDDDPDVVSLKILVVTFMVTDRVILAYCTNAAGESTAHMAAPLGFSRLVGTTPTTCVDAAREIEGLQRRPIVLGKTFFALAKYENSHWRYCTLLLQWLFISLLLLSRAGSSPTLIRWYQMREKVLEKVRQRDILRSRILSHQVSMATSSARRSNRALKQVSKQQVEVKIQLEELIRLVAKANQASSRPTKVNDFDDTADTQTAASPIQQESAQSSVGADDTIK